MRIHPYQTIFWFLIAGISVLFGVLTIAYLFSSSNWSWEQFRFPKFFLISTFIILAASYNIHQILPALQNENLVKILFHIKMALVIGSLFLVCQCISWIQLTKNGIFFNGHPDGTYLYLISGVHAFHIIAGLIYLVYLHFKLSKISNDSVKILIFSSQPENKALVQSLVYYWHYLDIVWIYLLLFFLFNHL